MERTRRFGKSIPWVAAILLVVLALPGSAVAQETRGKITGRVTDASKAVIPGATVTATDVARGTSNSAVSNDQGLYTITYLVPGTYKVVVELQGFKKFVRENVQLQMTQTLTIDAALEVGAMEESVSVVAEAPVVNTADANLGLTVDQKKLASLPLIHGDPYKIMGLAPGLAHSGSQRLDRPYEPTHIVGYAYQGTRSNRSDLLIDGAPSTATANANEVIATYVPPSDLVQEFKVQTATFDAQFGNTEGGVTSITIKSGTNKLHGSGYYWAEPYKLGANDFFGKARGQSMIKSSSNRPGFTIGGPVKLPKLYNGTDKTFFMFGYEHITDIRPRFDAGASSWVPTPELRNGDFSAYAGNILIYDPLTRNPAGSSFSGTPFPGNIIPANRISPIAKRVLEYYSQPKNPGLSGNIFDSTLPETAKYNSITGRVDQQISKNNRMFARYSWYFRDSTYNNYLNSLATETMFQFKSNQFVLDDVHVINPTMVLNVRYGYNRFDRISGYQDQVYGFDETLLGFPASYNNLLPAASRLFPRFDFDGGMLGTGVGGDNRPVTTHSVAATLNKAAGAHALKSGIDIRIYGERNNPPGNDQTGRYQFTNAYTRLNSASGSDYLGLQAYAAFLLGLPTTTTIVRPATYDEKSPTMGFFIQDDWKIGRRLTVNLGLRYEVETPMTEKNNGSVSNFDYAYVQPIQAAAQAAYANLNDPALKALVPTLSTKGGLMFLGLDTPKLYATPKNTILPRVGIAYQLSPSTVVRAGAGLFAGFLGERRGDVIQTGYSQTTTFPTTFNAGGAPIPYYLDNVLLTTPIVEPVGNAAGKNTSIGNAITFFNPNPKVSKQLRWQASIQHELFRGLSAEVTYVGNHGYDIEINRNINTLPIQYLNTDNSVTAAMTANNQFLGGSVANPFAGLLPGTGLNNATTSRRQLLRPYPSFGDITTTNNDGKTWYHALQLSLQRRFASGYSVGLAYTYSHWMQQTEYLNAADPTPTKVISDLDVPHRLSVTGIYELPFGRGKKVGSNVNSIVNGFIGGWQVQGVYTYQTGFPIGFGDVFYNGGEIAIDNPTTAKWFNTDVFTSVLNATSAAATPLDHLRSFPLRMTEVRRDAINNVDISLIKSVTFSHGMRAEVRMEFINALNEPYFPAPVTGVTSADFGKISASNQENYARRAQIGVKLIF